MDRDGTVCREVNYLSRPEDLVLFPFTSKSIRILNENDFLVIIITNQSGIGRGFIKESVLEEIHAKLKRELEPENAVLDAIYYCPHVPGDNCVCRKPRIGLIERACSEFGIDLANSWMVGDKAIDVETGYNSGCRTALVRTGYGQNEIRELRKMPDLITENLESAVFEIIRLNKTL